MATRNSASSTGMKFNLGHTYTFREPVYHGPMTTIYRGVWNFFDRDVYISSAEGLLGLKPTSRTIQRIFTTIADEAGAIRGSHLPDVLDSSRIDKITAVVVMRLPPGMILSDYIEAQGALTPDQTWRVLRGVSRALAHCREQAGPHRGATPDRIWLCDDGEAILLGYGEALRRREINLLSGHTANEIWWHTPPEVLRDAGDEQSHEQFALRSVIGSDALPDLEDSPSAEVWALGALAYYCLQGHHPYYVKPNDHQHGIVNTLRDVRLPLQDDIAYLQPLIDRALRPLPTARYPDCAALVSDFYAIIHPGADESDVSTGPQTVLPGMPTQITRRAVRDDNATRSEQIRANLWRTAAIALTIALIAYAWLDIRRPRALVLTSNPEGIELVETTGHLKTPRGRTPVILSNRRLNDPITLQTVGPSGDLGKAVTILPSSFADLGRCLHAEIVPDFTPATSDDQNADEHGEPAADNADAAATTPKAHTPDSDTGVSDTPGPPSPSKAIPAHNPPTDTP